MYRSLILITLFALATACSTTESHNDPAARTSASVHRSGAIPAWLILRQGVKVRIDIATWPGTDRVAAVTRSLDGYKNAASQKPDALNLPVGVLATVDKIVGKDMFHDYFVKVHGGGWNGFTRSDQIVPLVPAGTVLVALGGIAVGDSGHTTALFATRDSGYSNSTRIASGTKVEIQSLTFAAGDPDQTTALARYGVKVLDGNHVGQTGWMSSLGVPGLIPMSFPDCKCVTLQMYTPEQALKYHSS